MASLVTPDSSVLKTIAITKMPFGRYQGTLILDLPELYLLWFQQKGFPNGSLGQMMALALEIKTNGLEKIVKQALEHEEQDQKKIKKKLHNEKDLKTESANRDIGFKWLKKIQDRF